MNKTNYSIRVTDKQKKKIQKVSDELKTTVANAIEIVIDHYINKPTQTEEIIKIIEEQLRRKGLS